MHERCPARRQRRSIKRKEGDDRIACNGRVGITGITDAIAIGIDRCELGDMRAKIAGIADPIAVFIVLRRISDRRAIVDRVGNAVTVDIVVAIDVTRVDWMRRGIADRCVRRRIVWR